MPKLLLVLLVLVAMATAAKAQEAEQVETQTNVICFHTTRYPKNMTLSASLRIAARLNTRVSKHSCDSFFDADRAAYQFVKSMGSNISHFSLVMAINGSLALMVVPTFERAPIVETVDNAFMLARHVMWNFPFDIPAREDPVFTDVTSDEWAKYDAELEASKPKPATTANPGPPTPASSV